VAASRGADGGVLARRLRHFTTQAFTHVKELTKAEQYEAHKAMRRRFFTTMRDVRRQRPLGRVIDEGGMHPPTRMRGSSSVTVSAHPRTYLSALLRSTFPRDPGS
jgi:hypothetical protein